MKTITMYLVLIYAMVIVATSAGAIQYGFDASEHFYTVMGALNLVFGGYGIYRAWRKENPKE